MKKRPYYHYLVFLFAMCLSACGSALTIRASIGNDAWNGFSKTLSPLIGIKIGTLSSILNNSCILIEFLLFRKDFRLRNLFGFLLMSVTGEIINFFYYNFFLLIPVSSYLVNLLLIIIGNLLNGIAMGAMLDLDLVNFPLASLLNKTAEKTHKSYAFWRRLVDVFCIIGILIMAFGFGGELNVREGTLIATLIFGPFVDYFKKLFRPLLKYDGE